MSLNGGMKKFLSLIMVLALLPIFVPVKAPVELEPEPFAVAATVGGASDQTTPLVHVGSLTRINFPVKPTSKVLRMQIVANNISWPLDGKLNELRNWFYSQSDKKLIMNIDVNHTQYKDVPFIQHEAGAAAGNSQSYQMVDPAWYDKNISSKAKNYDLVLFLLPIAEWPNQVVAGWRTDHDNGPVELQLRADEIERSYSQGYPVSAFVDLTRHEVVHAMFMMSGQEDLTHEYYYGAKFDQVVYKVDLAKIKPIR